MLLVLFVIFIIVMVMWGLIKAGSIAGNPDWLAFIAVLILGIVVFLLGTGVIVIERPFAH